MKRLSVTRRAWWFVILTTMLGGILFLFRYKERSDPPSPPFPLSVKGTPVVWIPDRETRDVAKGLTLQNVISIEMWGGGLSGVPTSALITRKDTIALFLQGIRLAVKRQDLPYIKESCPSGTDSCYGGMLPRDSLEITFQPSGGGAVQTRQMVFYADIMEGELRMMPCGTVSPRFQDALRAAGVPKRRPENIVQSWSDEFRIFMRRN